MERNTFFAVNLNSPVLNKKARLQKEFLKITKEQKWLQKDESSVQAKYGLNSVTSH